MDSIDLGVVNEPELQTLLPQVFGVSQTGIDVCLQLIEKEQATTDEIATALGINRTTATRQLNQLRELGIVERQERSLNEGGQIHVYAPVSLDEIRQRHLEGFLTWVADAIVLINGIDSRKLQTISETEAPEPSQKSPADQ